MIYLSLSVTIISLLFCEVNRKVTNLSHLYDCTNFGERNCVILTSEKSSSIKNKGRIYAPPSSIKISLFAVDEHIIDAADSLREIFLADTDDNIKLA